MNPILAKYRNVKPLNDIDTTDSMLRLLIEMSVQEQQRFWIKGEWVGYVCVFTHEAYPGKLIEYVQGSQEDSVTTLYEASPLLSDLRRLTECRADLINEIGRVTMALPSTVAVYDRGRERQAMLKELGTAQLIDVLAHFSHTDLATV